VNTVVVVVIRFLSRVDHIELRREHCFCAFPTDAATDAYVRSRYRCCVVQGSNGAPRCSAVEQVVPARTPTLKSAIIRERSVLGLDDHTWVYYYCRYLYLLGRHGLVVEADRMGRTVYWASCKSKQ
jgi:hypothetical protein